jgi:large subunit ribosomal protein L14e
MTRGIKREALRKAINDYGLEARWGETTWARKIEKTTRRANLTDFDRFKVKVLKQRRRVVFNKALSGRK